MSLERRDQRLVVVSVTAAVLQWTHSAGAYLVVETLFVDANERARDTGSCHARSCGSALLLRIEKLIDGLPSLLERRILARTRHHRPRLLRGSPVVEPMAQ